jgi:hypothetical protein
MYIIKETSFNRSKLENAHPNDIHFFTVNLELISLSLLVIDGK